MPMLVFYCWKACTVSYRTEVLCSSMLAVYCAHDIEQCSSEKIVCYEAQGLERFSAVICSHIAYEDMVLCCVGRCRAHRVLVSRSVV